MLSKFLFALMAALALASNDTSGSASASDSASASAAASSAAASASGNATAASSSAASAAGNATSAAASSAAASAAGNATAAASSSAAAATGNTTAAASSSAAAATAASSSAAAATGNTTATKSAAASASGAGAKKTASASGAKTEEKKTDAGSKEEEKKDDTKKEEEKTDDHAGHDHGNNTNTSDLVITQTAMSLASPQKVTMTGLNASVKESCPDCAKLATGVILSSMKEVMKASGISAQLCTEDDMLPAKADGKLHSACYTNPPPETTGLATGYGFDKVSKTPTTKECARRRLDNRRRLDGHASVTATPTLKVSQVAAEANAAAVTKAKTALADTAALQKAVAKTHTELMVILETGTAADMTKFLGGLPKVVAADGKEADLGLGAVTGEGNAATVTFADVQKAVASAVKAASAATITVESSAPVETQPSSTTSGAAQFFLSFATLAGAFLLC